MYVCYISFVNLSEMATTYPEATEHGDDNFVLELNREKDKIRTRFIELREILTETENKLMKELNASFPSSSYIFTQSLLYCVTNTVF